MRILALFFAAEIVLVTSQLTDHPELKNGIKIVKRETVGGRVHSVPLGSESSFHWRCIFHFFICTDRGLASDRLNQHWQLLKLFTESIQPMGE